MKVISYRRDGRDSFGVVTEGGPQGGRAVDAGGFDPALGTVLDVLRASALPRLAKYAAGRAPDIDLSRVTLLPPVTGSAKVLCAGVNYAPHLAEGSDLSQRGGQGALAASQFPTVFTRFADTHVAHGAPLVRPSVTSQFDYEGELLAVIGREVHQETPEQAADAVAGWSCYNDATVRDWQVHTSQWIPGKNFPATGGFGPWLVTADETGPATGFELTTRVNGEEVQHAKITEMIFDVPALVSYISQFTPLGPGDLVLTGTPSGVGAARNPRLWLNAGDVVEVEISQVGTLRNPVTDEQPREQR